MSEPTQPPAPVQQSDGRHLPVLAAEARPLEPRGERSLSTPALAATGGFLAALATFVLARVVRRGRGRSLPLGRRRRRKALDVAASRSFLVDVHLLRR